MKLSVCIPVYNTDVRELVNALYRQCEELQEEVEIILIDDCSALAFREKNEELKEKNNVHYYQLNTNVGRSKIRNLFLNIAKGEYLLFLDGDSLMAKAYQDDFLMNYIDEIGNKSAVICGGRIYPVISNLDQQLSYQYGIKRESRNAEQRSVQPNTSFMTNNFAIRREILEQIRFDERLTRYGHEDTLFGIELAAAGIVVTHIENPVLNGHVEKNDEFLRKTRAAIDNLHLILQFQFRKEELINAILLIKKAEEIRKMKLRLPVVLVYRLTRKQIENRLIKGKINLRLFDFYKLGYFLSIRA